MKGLHLTIAVATDPAEALPLLMGVHFGPVSIVWEVMSPQAALQALEEGKVLAAVLSPAQVLGAGRPLRVVERLASSGDEALVWRTPGGVLFHWADLQGRVVISPPSSVADFEAALRPYGDVVKIPPSLTTGTVTDFLGGKGDFYVAKEPEASLLILQGRASLAQPLAAETGPWPSAVLCMEPGVATAWPRLGRAIIRALWENALTLDRSTAQQLADRLQADFPGVPRSALVAAFTRLRQMGVFPADPRVRPPTGSRLSVVFPEVDWQPFFHEVDDHLADQALRTTY